MQQSPSDPSNATITVYWRPGCGFCSSLRRHLDRHGVPHELVNIWDEPDGATFVRSVARGNETVPTVAIGDVALVNPSIDEVLAAAAVHAPSAVPADYTPPEPRGVGRLINRMLGGER